MSLPGFMNPQTRRVRADTWSAPLPPGGGRAPGGRPIPGFPLAKQAMSNWCWAAVASGVDAVLGGRRSQCQVATEYGPRSVDWTVKAALTPPCCPPKDGMNVIGYLNEVLDVLDLTRERYRDIVDSDATATDCKAELQASRPVPIRIAWSDQPGDGHFITLVGNGDGGTFVVYDPSEAHEDDGHVRYLTKDGLAAGYDGRGSWSHMYPVKKAGT